MDPLEKRRRNRLREIQADFNSSGISPGDLLDKLPCIKSKGSRERIDCLSQTRGSTAALRELSSILPGHTNWFDQLIDGLEALGGETTANLLKNDKRGSLLSQPTNTHRLQSHSSGRHEAAPLRAGTQEPGLPSPEGTQYSLDMSVRKLPIGVWKALAIMDISEPPSMNWSNLAALFNVSWEDSRWLEQSSSKSAKVIEQWSEKYPSHATLRNLLLALESLQRFDVIEEVNKVLDRMGVGMEIQDEPMAASGSDAASLRESIEKPRPVSYNNNLGVSGASKTWPLDPDVRRKDQERSSHYDQDHWGVPMDVQDQFEKFTKYPGGPPDVSDGPRLPPKKDNRLAAAKFGRSSSTKPVNSRAGKEETRKHRSWDSGSHGVGTGFRRGSPTRLGAHSAVDAEVLLPRSLHDMTPAPMEQNHLSSSGLTHQPKKIERGSSLIGRGVPTQRGGGRDNRGNPSLQDQTPAGSFDGSSEHLGSSGGDPALGTNPLGQQTPQRDLNLNSARGNRKDYRSPGLDLDRAESGESPERELGLKQSPNITSSEGRVDTRTTNNSPEDPRENQRIERVDTRIANNSPGELNNSPYQREGQKIDSVKQKRQAAYAPMLCGIGTVSIQDSYLRSGEDITSKPPLSLVSLEVHTDGVEIEASAESDLSELVHQRPTATAVDADRKNDLSPACKAPDASMGEVALVHPRNVGEKAVEYRQEGGSNPGGGREHPNLQKGDRMSRVVRPPAQSPGNHSGNERMPGLMVRPQGAVGGVSSEEAAGPSAATAHPKDVGNRAAKYLHRGKGNLGNGGGDDPNQPGTTGTGGVVGPSAQPSVNSPGNVRGGILPRQSLGAGFGQAGAAPQFDSGHHSSDEGTPGLITEDYTRIFRVRDPNVEGNSDREGRIPAGGGNRGGYGSDDREKRGFHAGGMGTGGTEKWVGVGEAVVMRDESEAHAESLRHDDKKDGCTQNVGKAVGGAGNVHPGGVKSTSIKILRGPSYFAGIPPERSSPREVGEGVGRNGQLQTGTTDGLVIPADLFHPGLLGRATGGGAEGNRGVEVGLGSKDERNTNPGTMYTRAEVGHGEGSGNPVGKQQNSPKGRNDPRDVLAGLGSKDKKAGLEKATPGTMNTSADVGPREGPGNPLEKQQNSPGADPDYSPKPLSSQNDMEAGSVVTNGGGGMGSSSELKALPNSDSDSSPKSLRSQYKEGAVSEVGSEVGGLGNPNTSEGKLTGVTIPYSDPSPKPLRSQDSVDPGSVENGGVRVGNPSTSMGKLTGLPNSDSSPKPLSSQKDMEAGSVVTNGGGGMGSSSEPKALPNSDSSPKSLHSQYKEGAVSEVSSEVGGVGNPNTSVGRLTGVTIPYSDPSPKPLRSQDRDDPGSVENGGGKVGNPSTSLGKLTGLPNSDSSPKPLSSQEEELVGSERWSSRAFMALGKIASTLSENRF